jgi:hypothetical protein
VNTGLNSPSRKRAEIVFGQESGSRLFNPETLVPYCVMPVVFMSSLKIVLWAAKSKHLAA